MTGPLLRTGTLTAFHPLGAVGNPVYLAAAQLRAALSRRLGADLADSFAIPQRNEDGDTVDWYAPRPGAVVPWSAAGSDERAEARRRLLENRERIEELGRSLGAGTDSESQVFGRLLAHVTSFPDEDHIYLVDGLPVVTFWGFVRDQDSAGFDPLMNPSLLAAPPVPQAPPRRRWWPWLLLLLLLLLLALGASLFALRACQPDSILSAPPPGTGVDAGPAADDSGSIPDAESPRAQTFDDTGQVSESPGERDSVTVDRRRIERDVHLDTAEGSHRVTRISGDDERDTLLHGAGTDDEVHVSGEGGDAKTAVTDIDEIGTPDDERVDERVDTEGVVESSGEAESVDDAEAAPVESTDGSPGDAAPPQVQDDTTAEGTDTGPGDATAEGPAEPPEDEAAATDVEPETPPTPEAPDEAAPPEADGAAAKPEPDDQAPPTAPGPEETTGQAGPTGRKPDAVGPIGAATRSPEELLRTGWRTATSLQDANGMPIQMEYQMQDGAGRIRVKRHDGSVCENAAATEVRDGKVIIDSDGNIVCRDGTSFGDPTIECEQDRDGKVGCTGRYPDGRTFSIDPRQPGH